MPLEDIWREFFSWRANNSHYSIYVHTHHGFYFPSTSFFYQKQVNSSFKSVKWGGMSQVKAIKTVVRAALLDPLNERFCLMSESCIPLHSFNTFRNSLLADNRSVTNACWLHPSEAELDTRWRPTLDGLLKKEHWRKSATWFALNRKHASLFVNELAMEDAWDAVPCCDEHYLPTILAHYGVDNETTCSDGFIHHYFPSPSASHPVTHSTDEINAEFFQYLNRPLANSAGFGMLCSGIKDICHFTARKFSGASKYHLLENLDLILNEDGILYDGDPFAHHRSLLRYLSKADEHGNNIKEYYIIDYGMLRRIPDNITLCAMHLRENDAVLVTAEEKVLYPFGLPYPSRVDGVAIRANKRQQVYVINNGRKRAIPNIDTFFSLNLSFNEVHVTSEFDIEQIPLGPPIPPVGH